MVIFHHAGVYIDNKWLQSIQKQIKLQRSIESTHSTFPQPVHFPQTDLRHP